MKRNLLFSLMAFLVMVLSTSCTGVESGSRGVEVSWGGKTNMDVVYGEGIDWGVHWMWDDMIEYDVREKTIIEKFEFNDKNNMSTPVAVSIDYKLDAQKVNTIHSTIGKDQLDMKIMTTLSSAAKQVIPQYSASELNLSKREEAEGKIFSVLKEEFPAFYVSCSRVRITDVDIPRGIAEAAEANAKQTELNKLSASKVEQARNNLLAAEFDSKAQALLSRPEMIALKKLEVEMTWAKKGISPYGHDNVFGAETTVVKGLK